MKACLSLLALGTAEKNHSAQARKPKLLPGLLPAQLSTPEQSQFSLQNPPCPTSAAVISIHHRFKSYKTWDHFYSVDIYCLYLTNHFILHNLPECLHSTLPLCLQVPRFRFLILAPMSHSATVTAT